MKQTNDGRATEGGYTPESIKLKVIDIIYSEMRLHDDESALRSILSSVQRIEIATTPIPSAEDEATDYANGVCNIGAQPALWHQSRSAYIAGHAKGFAAGAKEVGVKKVCYCGSLRKAMDAFKKAEYEAVMKGEIALLPCCMFVDIEREYGAESDYKQKADNLHKRKIDICDEVMVLNVGGYVGQSTRSEIDYALSIGKPVKYLEPINN